MRNQRRILVVKSTAILVILSAQLPTFAQGSLTPPGSPAPTMKTLDQVEPRIPLNATTTPGDASYRFIITNSGSYYFTDNVLVTNNHGIDIRAAGVTLDLMGYEIRRTASSGGNGIEIDTAAHRCVVRNGSVAGFGTGVSNPSQGADSGRFESLSVMNCFGNGLVAGRNWTFVDCTSVSNSGSGIRADFGSRLTRCAVSDSGGDGIVVGASCVLVQCTVMRGAGTYGIFAGRGAVLNNCTAGANSTTYGIYAGISSVVSGCAIYQTTSDASTGFGIYTEDRCLVENCTISQSTSSFAGTDSDLTDTGVGIHVGGSCTVRNCAVAFNEGDGISCSGDCLIVDNNSAAAGNIAGLGAAIHVFGLGSTVKGNMVKDSDYGIKVEFGNNLIVANMAQGNGTNYVIVSGNKVGTIVAAPNSVAISGSTGGAGVGTTDPWANISY